MKSDKTRVIDGPTMKPTLPFPLVMCQKRRGKGGSINNKTATTMQTLFVLSAAIAGTTSALSATTQTRSPTTPLPSKQNRPLLREFGRGINERVLNSKSGCNRRQYADCYTSSETIPCLDMQTSTAHDNHIDLSSKRDIRKAYTANENIIEGIAQEGIHGRSSGSGCCIIRLHGDDARSVRGLVGFADDFFEGVDDSSRNSAINDLGVFRIGNNIHAGFDNDVNDEGKMQVLYTKLIPQDDENSSSDPLLLPLEVGELVGANSLSRAQSGMGTLMDIGSQITSAVLGMNAESTNKLLDDCTDITTNRRQHEMVSDNADKIADNVSNSYQRIIRYLKPQSAAQEDAAFWPHVDSTFLTLIPLPEIAGLEVWCPSSTHSNSDDLAQRGEWVRPIKPSGDTVTDSSNRMEENDCIHVIALAGEFLQLLSNGHVPTCIHRVIAPKPPSPSAFGFAPKKYKPRVSAPLFLRPRRNEEATLDVQSDLREPYDTGLYFQKGLLGECDSMRVWDYMECMSPDN